MAEDRKISIKAVLDATDVTAGLIKIENAGKRASSSLADGAKQAGDAVGKIGDGAAKSAAQVEASERRMEAAIKRRIAVLESAGKGERAYQEALISQRGYDSARFKPLLDQLDAAEKKAGAARAALSATTPALQQMGVSAAQTAAALRNVPAQFTDIATSLAGGQAPLTVLLQQGGQLKDMFGGIGPAARALGGYIAGLVNPFTLAAAGAGALALAWIQGQKEAEAYNRALILSGNAIGATAGQLAQMARSLSDVNGTQGAAAAALAEMAGSSQIAGRNLEAFTQVALGLERTVGQSVAETRKQFDELGKSPLQALVRINEGTNFLTASLYENVRALQEQGRFTEAAETAQRGYAAAMAERTRALVENTGVIERAWKGVTGAAKSAWDAMLNVGRPASAADQVAQLDREIAKLSGPDRLSNRVGVTALLGGGDAARLDALKQQRAALLELTRLEEEGNAQRAESVRRTQAIIAADEVRLRYATKQKQMEVEIAQARSRLQAAGAPDAEIAAIERQIRERYKEAGNTGAIRATNTELQRQGDLLAKLAGLTTTFAEDWARINGLFAAGKISREETLRLQSELLAQQPEMKDAAKEEAEARKEAERAAKDQFEAQKRLIEQQAAIYKSAEDEVRTLRQAAEERGLSADAIERLRVARLNEADAIEIQRQNMMLMEATSTGEVAAIERTIAALEERQRLRSSNAEANIAQREAQEWQRAYADIERGLVDSLFRAAESGKDIFESLRDAIRGMFNNLVLKPIINAVVNPISQGITGVLGGAGGVANAASSGGGLLGSLGGLAGSLGGLASGVGFGFQGLLGSLGLGGSSISGVLGVAGTLASQGSVMAALGTVAGALGPIALGVAGIAALLKDGGGPKTGGSFSTDGSRLFTPADQDALAATFGQSIEQGYTQALARLGGSNPGLQYGIGFDLDPQGDAASRVSSFIGTYRENDTEIGRTTDEMQAGVAQAVQRAILAGLQQSDFPAQIESIFDGLDVASATQEQIGAAIQAAEAMRGLLDVAGALRVPLDAVSQAMIDAAGGVESLTAGFASYYEITRTEEEKLADLRTKTAESFAALGFALPATIDGYRELVESLDLSTEAGQAAYGSLVLLAPAMQQLAQTTDGLTASIGAMTEAAAGAVQAASGWPTADDWIQYANAIGDPEVLATSLKRSFSEAWARLELGDAFPVPTTIEQFKAAIAGLNVSAMGSAEWAGKLRGALNLSPEFASLINATSNFGAAAVNAANSISSAISSLGSIRSLLSDADFKARLSPLVEQQWVSLLQPVSGALQRLGVSTALPQSKAELLAAYDEISAVYPEIAETIAREFLPAWSDLTQSVTAVEKPARAAAKAVNTMADQIRGALQSLADYARGLFASDLAPGTPEEQLKAAQALYSETLGKAQSGDLNAINNLRTVSDTYLREAREFYASSAGYTAIFKSITDALLALTGSSAPGAVVTVQQDERLLREAQRQTKYSRDTSRTLRRETARV